MSESNPIEARLDRLVRQWDAFAREREARMLRWVFAPDEWRMFEALLAREQHAEGELPVLFVVLATPFESGARHGHELLNGGATIVIEGGKVSISSLSEIALTVGANSVKIDATGVSIAGALVDVAAVGVASVSGATVKLN